MTITRAGNAGERSNESLADRLEISELSARLGLLIDARDWDALEAIFKKSVAVDYTSLKGGEPEAMAVSDLLDEWRQVFRHLDATQHLIAGAVVELDGDRATCAANVQGTHVAAHAPGGATFTVGGRYDIGFERTAAGWRIDELTLTVQWLSGNPGVLAGPSDSQG